MKIRVQSIHFKTDKKLLRFIKKRADKLDQFFDRIVMGEVFLKLQKRGDDMNKVVEFKVSVPGNQLFVKQRCRSFEEAADLAVEALRRQLDRHKSRVRVNLSAHKELLVEDFA